MPNSIDIIKPFALTYRADNLSREKLVDGLDCNVQIIGGVGSAALLDPKTIIDVDRREIIAPKDLDLPNIRDNGSLRDVDILVLSSIKSYIDWVKFNADQKIQGLEPSVFGFKTSETLRRQFRRPFGYAALKTFLSDRYECLDEIRTNSGLVKALYPFAVPIDRHSHETWTQIIGDTYLPVPNPAMSIINYSNRSISGVRDKDAKKVILLAENIFKKAPSLRDWAIDGPGSSQVELGHLIDSLNPDGKYHDVIETGRRLYTNDELMEQEAFIPARTEKLSVQRRILAIAAIKSRVLSYGESNKQLVALFQLVNAERRLDSVVENK